MKAFVNRRIFLFIVGICGLIPFALAQQKNISYTIVSKNDSIGTMKATQRISGDDAVYTLISVVETKILMTIQVNVQEEAHYHKEKLLSSSSKRIVNGRPKGNKQTNWASDGYVVTDDGKKSRIDFKSIPYDFLKLYFKEPVAVSQVYSDYYQKLLSIKTVNPHVYQIDLPEGGSNTYYYENGVCRKVDIRGALFNAQMILNG